MRVKCSHCWALVWNVCVWASDWSVVVSNTLSMLMHTGRYSSFSQKECVRVCVRARQVVNYMNVFVRLCMFQHAHADHRPDRQVLISCHGYRWCVLTVTVVMTESPASEQRGMLGLTQGPLSHHAVCVYTVYVCVCVCWRRKISEAVTSLLVSLSISQWGTD